MKKVYLFIAVLVLALIFIDSNKTLPKGIAYALGAAIGYIIGAIIWNAIKKRKRNNDG